MPGLGFSETRAEEIKRETGSAGVELPSGNQGVDFDRIVKEERPASQTAQEQPAYSESPVAQMAGAALEGSNVTAKQPAREEERRRDDQGEQVKREQAQTERVATPRSASVANPIGAARDEMRGASGSAAATMQAQQAGPAPAPHPGGNLVLNMRSGKIENSAEPEMSYGNGAQVSTASTNEISEGGNLVAPTRAKMESDPTTNPVLNPPEKKVSDEAKTVSQRMEARRMQDEGRDEIRREGVVTPPTVPNTLTSANRTFAKIRSILKDKVDRAMKRKTYSGMSFYETIFSKPDLMPHCVSIGSENLYESLREPNSNLLSLVNSKLPPDQQLSLEECLADIQLLVDAINSVNIEVTLDKSPVNINHSIQVRVLRAHMGRGIGLHPTQTKAFNADYDGDPAVINLDQTQLVRYARAMDRLVSVDGKALIDPGFFPLERVDNRDEVLDLLRDRNMSWNPKIANDVIDAYIAACNEGDWVYLLRRIDEIADREAMIDGTRNEYAAAILKSLYDFSIDIRALSINSQLDNVNSEHSNYNPPDPGTDPFVLNLVNLTDEIVAGRRPPSFIEFNRFYNKYYGDVEGMKNVPFRLLADFAKAINRTDLVTVGSDLFGFKLTRTENGNHTLVESEDETVTLHELWQFTCVAGLTKQISGRCYMGSREFAVSTQVRAMVLKEVPIRNWVDDQDFRNWIDEFKTSYNLNMRMLNLAQVSFRGGMSINRSESIEFDGIGDNLEGIDEALVKVYGQKTVGTMFPSLIREGSSTKANTNTNVARYHRNMTLEKFSMNNRLEFRSVRTGYGKNETRESRSDYIARRIRSGEYNQMDILMLIADRRTKQLGRYNTEWRKVTAEHFNSVKLHGIYEGEDYVEYMDNIMETISMMSPEMFLHFGMDSPTTFRNSKWGKKLFAAETVDEYQSVLLAMQVEYRLGKSSQILSEINQINEWRGNTDLDDFEDTLDDLEDALQCEFDSLASSSMVWKTIVKESMNGNATFKMLMQKNGVVTGYDVMYGKTRTVTVKRPDGTEEKQQRGFSFWDRPAEEKEKYYSLINFLKSSEPINVKLAVLADVTRVSEGYPDVHPNEVLGQLAYHPDRLHAGNRFDMMDKGIKTDIDYLKESMDALTSYRDNTPAKIRQEAADFLVENAQDTNKFVNYMGRLATDPGYAVHVDTLFAADAIASVFDKTYADSEKIHQQAGVNGYFGCISYQRSGGYYTHLYMTDNAVVNMVGFDQITPRDILLVLSDPTVKLYAYDEFGTPVELSRQALCGGNTNEDVMRYLEDNPKIVLMCKRCMAGVNSKSEGNARIKSINDSQMFDTGEYHVFSLLNDRPRFLAIAALLTRSDWRAGREISEEVNETILKLCKFVSSAAQSGKKGMELIEVIEKVTGLDMVTVARLRNEGSFDSEFDENDYDAAANLYTEVIEELLDCIGVVQASNVDLPPASGFRKIGNIDQSSMIAYYDVRQQISGGRTETMIGVEGAETKKNLAFKTLLKGRPDAYTMSADGKTVIPLVESLEQSSDQSLVHSEAMQTNSCCKYLEIKRENGAETFNAKYKKYGDDGSNSMIKFIRMAKRAVYKKFGKPEDHDMPNGTWAIEDGANLLGQIAACTSKDQAVPILAQALIDADIRLGYIDVNKETGKIEDDAFIPSDYWNRADLMLAQNSDGSMVVRTFEQLSAACRTRLSDDAVLSGDIDAVKEELEQIIAVVGTDLDPMLQRGADNIMHDIISGVKLPSKMGSKYRVDRALRQRSSSVERNYTLLYSMYKHYMSVHGKNIKDAIPSRKEIEEISARKFDELKRDRGNFSIQKTLQNGIAMPADVLRDDEWQTDVHGDRTYIYDYIGRAGDADLRLIPGPQSLILFDKPNDAMLQNCITYGITAAFTDESVGSLPDYLFDKLIMVSQEEYRESKSGNEYKALSNLWILPCFDIRLNEGVGEGSTMAAPSEVYINPDNAVVNCEDTTGEFKSGDATYHITKELADRIKVHFRGKKIINADQLFPNAKEFFGNKDYDIDYCSNEEVQRYILNAEFDFDNLVMRGPGGVSVIDIGIPQGDKRRFNREKERFAIRLQEYMARTDIDEDSIVIGDVGYDSIIGFVKINFHGADGGTVLAPIWPFHLEETGRAPTRYKAKLTLDQSEDSFVVDWEFTGDIEGQYIKFFEGIGASNKLITSGERVRSRQLENGISLDGFYASESVSSRLFSSNKRIHTMISAMMMTRLDPNYSYNFAELAESFPGNPTFTRPPSKEYPEGEVVNIKEALLNATLGKADWLAISKLNIQYHTDPQIDSVVRYWVNKCVGFGTVNPTTLLATRTPSGILWPKITEFECFMDPGVKFQEAWMKMMHAMMPTLMPDSIDGKSDDCLFVPVTGENIDEDYGVLRMRVPHWDSDGRQYTKLENVYISMGFFGEEFSGFKKVNFNAYKRSIDNLNVANEVNGNDLIQLLTFARAGMSGVKPATHLEVTPENVYTHIQKLNPDEVK